MKKTVLNLSLAIALIIFLLLGVNYGLSMYTHHGEKIPVPDLHGLELDEVKNLLDELELRYEIRDSLFEENMPRNSVLKQDPDTGEFVKEGRIIYLSINNNEVPKVKMPDLTDKNIHQALMILEGLGIMPGKIDTTENIAEDAVIEQRHKGKIIRPDTEIPQGSVIDLVIGDGSGGGAPDGEVSVPDLIGSTLGDARIILDAYGLAIGVISSQGKITDSSEATIVSQNPSYEPDTRITKGTAVSLTIQQ